ncbi:MAG: hypothetical protein EB127_03415 [Alphaproteobacteria bacterium]|nr:hypothetical protein [Alphaproteobacteria bacterium]
MADNKIEKLVLIIPRSSIQAGIPNERYPEKLLRDSRLTNHIPTDAVMVWKNFISAGNDSKFTDLKSSTEEVFAEGKCIHPKRGVNFRPSVDTGGGRGFRQENLDACFAKNAFYFLYETTIITDTTIQFDIYWVPIALICQWYSEKGNRGTITYPRVKECISQCEIEQTEETRD